MDLGAFSRLESKIEELLSRLAALEDENGELRTQLTEKTDLLSRIEEQTYAAAIPRKRD
jgi:hypothetical protein